MLNASAHFFRLPFSPSFFSPGESLFFSVESTPENSRRHLVAELLITASLHLTRPICVSPSLSPPLSLPLSCIFSFLFRCPRISRYVCTAVAIVAFRALDCSTRTNETRPFARCRLANGVASHRVDGTGFTGLHRRGSVALHHTC